MQIKPVSSHLSLRKAITKKTKTANTDSETEETLFSVGGNVNQCCHSGDQYGSILSSENRSILLPLCIPKHWMSYHRDTCTSHLFTTAKKWNQRKSTQHSPSTEECLKKMQHTYAEEFYADAKKDEIVTFSEKWTEVKIWKSLCQAVVVRIGFVPQRLAHRDWHF